MKGQEHPSCCHYLLFSGSASLSSNITSYLLWLEILHKMINRVQDLPKLGLYTWQEGRRDAYCCTLLVAPVGLLLHTLCFLPSVACGDDESRQLPFQLYTEICLPIWCSSLKRISFYHGLLTTWALRLKPLIITAIAAAGSRSL